jgi:L-fuculose-phosphate aldolase
MGETLLITPSGSDKGRMKSSEIGEMGFDGRFDGSFRPSIESRMHIEIYRTRPDVTAIVHAHPTACGAIAAGGATINTRLLAESYAILREVAYVEYILMGTEELARSVGAASAGSDCIVMRNHGVLAVGESLLQAFDRLEVLEAAAMLTLLSGHFLPHHANELNREELSALDRLLKR